MLWLTSKIQHLVTSINPNDIAFLLASSLEINKQKKSSMKAQAALDCLSSYKSFKKYIFEFYLKEDKKFRCVALTGVDKEIFSSYKGRSVKHGSTSYNIFNSKKMKFDTDIEKEVGRRKELLVKLGIKSSLILPIDISGILVVNKYDGNKFDNYEILLLKHFVEDVLTPSLDLALDNEKNMEAAIRDPLTGLYNHGYFMFQLDVESEQSLRGNYSVSLVMIDIDYFKNYNDMHGHPMGDKVLIDVAKILKDNTRRGDLVARYGGEEFAVLLFNVKLRTAENKAEELRKAIADHIFEKEELQPNGNLTISLGVASLPKQAISAGDLLEKADKALYKSKTSGKNKVTIYYKNLK